MRDIMNDEQNEVEGGKRDELLDNEIRSPVVQRILGDGLGTRRVQSRLDHRLSLALVIELPI